MSDIDNARRLHKILDRLAENNPLDSYDISQLRAALPELPKQKTLKEIYEFVDNVAYGTVRNVWRDDVHGDLAPFLHEVSSQLEGLADAEPSAAPALPEGMRLADHEEYGRVVVAPTLDIDDCYEIYYLDPGMSSGTDISGVEPDSLTFVDAKPSHPESLETEADFHNAPDGTIVVGKNYYPWTKTASTWLAYGAEARNDFDMGACRRYVLRWGDGE